jgi:hypothetical protein
MLLAKQLALSHGVSFGSFRIKVRVLVRLKCLHMVIQIPQETFNVLAMVIATGNDKYVFRILEKLRGK